MSHSCHPFWNATKPSRFSHFWQGAQSLAPATRNDIWTSKSGPNPSVSNMLTSKCASRHNSVPFFDISTSKSGLDLVCFVHVDFEMCFAPQRCALFRHLNFQKWSGPGVVCTFWIRHVLRATTACTFSTSQLPKVVRTWCVLYILTSKCASRHNGMHFFDILNVQKWSETLVFLTFWTTFGRSDVVSRGRCKGLCTLSKVRKTWGFCSISKKDGRSGTFEEDLQRCIFRGRRSTKDMFIRDVRRSGRWFPERGCILEHQIFRFTEMILRDRCSTSYDLASIFRGRRSTLDRWSGKIAKRIGTRLSALHSTFHFWRKSCRIAWFLMLSSSKIEDISQNCFVFDVVKFKNWGSLAGLFRSWRCQVQKLRRSRRIAALSSLQVDRQTGRQTDRPADKQIDR